MKRAAAVLLLLIAACGGRREAPKPAVRAPSPPVPNLLEIVRGASVVSRTAEATLEASAVRAVDGDARTAWVSPPSDGRQTLVFALPSSSRIDRVGTYTTSNVYVTPKSVRIDLSTDGVTYTTAGTFALHPSAELQLFRIPPTPAAFLRLDTLDDTATLQVNTAYAVGEPLAPVAPRSLDGCWTINGSPAVLTQQGAHVSGYVAGREATALDGGFDGRFFRFAWTRGREYGLAAISLTPDSTHLSGIVWHEEALRLAQFAAPDWIGERSPCSGINVPRAAVFRAFVERFQYVPLYGLRFDAQGRLDERESGSTLEEVTSFLAANPARTVRLIAHHLVEATPQANMAVAQRKGDTLRAALQRLGAPLTHVEFVIRGAERPRREADVDLTRAMYSSVELELAR